MWALHGPDFGWDPPRGKYILGWVIFPLTFLLHRFWRCAHHFGSQNDQELVPIQKADAGDKKEGGPSVWARNSCEDIEAGIVSEVWIAINVYIYIYTSIYLVLSCWASEATNTSYHSRREHLTRSFQSEGTQVQVSKSLRSLQQKLMKICRRGYRGSVRNHEFTWIYAKAWAWTSAFWNIFDTVKSILMSLMCW